MKDFVVLLKKNLQNGEVPLDSIRLNGGAASHVVGMRQIIDDIGYNDLDLIFGLKSDDEAVFENVRQTLYSTLRSLLPESEENSLALISDSCIDDGYVQKMVKVSNNNDCWSLISLYNNEGENVEVKFVHRMKRQYEFSVDSFQVELDSLLNYYELKRHECVHFTKEFYPTVMAESKYGKFDEALFHLNNKLVATLKPEEIRGGGLLKYCNLLLNGYNIADSDIKNMERYMCSRFFIDFPDASSQQNKLQNYMRTHLRKAPKSLKTVKAQMCNKVADVSKSSQGSLDPSADVGSSEDKENQGSQTPVQAPKEPVKAEDGALENHRIKFLVIVRRIIDDSTVCLMNIERACTLSLLDSLIWDLLRGYESKTDGKMSLDAAESGYFSENCSSVSNSLSSPSHFSRSSSPGISVNGTASRSSSPSAAAFAIPTSRLAHFDLAAITVPGTYLHPVSAAGGVHFTTTQMYHPFCHTLTAAPHHVAAVTSRGAPVVDQSMMPLNPQNHHHNQQHLGGNHNGGQYQLGANSSSHHQYHYHHHQNHGNHRSHNRSHKGGNYYHQNHYKGGSNHQYHQGSNQSQYMSANNSYYGGGNPSNLHYSVPASSQQNYHSTDGAYNSRNSSNLYHYGAHNYTSVQYGPNQDSFPSSASRQRPKSSSRQPACQSNDPSHVMVSSADVYDDLDFSAGQPDYFNSVDESTCGTPTAPSGTPSRSNSCQDDSTSTPCHDSTTPPQNMTSVVLTAY